MGAVTLPGSWAPVKRDPPSQASRIAAWSLKAGSTDTVLLSPQGSAIPISRDALKGFLDTFGVTDTSVEVKGWAGDMKGRRKASFILVFVGNAYVGLLSTGIEREDLVRGYDNPSLKNAGFYSRLPRAPFGSLDGSAKVRFFAIASDGKVASELSYIAQFPYER